MNKLSEDIQSTPNNTPSNHNEGEFSDNSDQIKTAQNDLSLQKDKDLAEAEELKNKLDQMDEQTYLNNFLKIDPHTFDQDKEKGWRKEISENAIKELALSAWVNTKGFAKGLQIMEFYLNNFPFNSSEEHQNSRQLIAWHIGQIYAMIGDHTTALSYLENNSSVNSEYRDATIAFLKKDKNSIDRIHQSIQNQDISNKNFINQLHTYFDNSYTEAYAGMNYQQIKDHFSKQ